MISATLRIWGSVPVESAGTSCPSSARFREALKVANRSVSRATAEGAATASSAAATKRARLSMCAPYAERAPPCEDSAQHQDDHDRGDDRHAEQRVRSPGLPLVLPEARARSVARVPALGRLAGPILVVAHRTILPARESALADFTPTRDRARDHQALDL